MNTKENKITKHSAALKLAFASFGAFALLSVVSPTAAQAQAAGLLGPQSKIDVRHGKTFSGSHPGSYQGLRPGFGANDPYSRYCAPCRPGDLECKRLQRYYCHRSSNVSGYGTSTGLGYGYSGLQPVSYQGSHPSGINGGISNSAAGSITFPGASGRTNFGIPFSRGDRGNMIQASIWNQEVAYQNQLYQWQVARKTAEWQDLKASQARRDAEWSDMIARRAKLAEEASQRAAAAEQAKQQETTAASSEPTGFAGRLFSIKNNQLITQAPEKLEVKPKPVETVLQTPAQTEAQRAVRSAEEKTSVLRHFKRALFGI